LRTELLGRRLSTVAMNSLAHLHSIPVLTVRIQPVGLCRDETPGPRRHRLDFRIPDFHWVSGFAWAVSVRDNGKHRPASSQVVVTGLFSGDLNSEHPLRVTIP